jgi:carboxyl-terminal processing protease
MNKLVKALMAVAILLTLSSYVMRVNYSSESDEKNQILMAMVMNYLENTHYQMEDLDDDFSEKAYSLYIKRLDYNKRIFMKKDIDELNKYQDKIDDEIREGKFGLYKRANEIQDERLKQIQGFYEEILATPFDFDTDETIQEDVDKREYAKDEKELKEVWRKSLKYQTLVRLNRKIDDQENLIANSDTVVVEKSFEELEEESREAVRKNMAEYFKRLDQVNDKDRITVYVNSVIGVFGPHTTYFPPEDKENFDISMSGKLEGIGARLSQYDGEIKVASIVPGSPSARQGDLKAGDVILSVAQENEEPVSIEEMRLDEAIKLIRGPKGTKVVLTVKKESGKVVLVPITRDVVEIEETYAKSYILEKNGQKTGYIKLPKFYTDFDNPNGRTCSKDVEIELEKLKEENVDGVILDLRNNGGGSLRDVVEMVGLFIDEGPVVQVRGRGGELEVLSDVNPGVVYDGPLVVMVNEYSASASEILAAAIQDYNRGIIVGSSSSFGKGTVQRFYDLDRFLSGQYLKFKPLGAVKVTTQKFYRINGGSTQLHGVTPDIIMPDMYSFIETGEKEQDYVMEWDQISPVPYKLWDATWSLDEIQAENSVSISQNPVFVEVEKMAFKVKDEQENTVVSLNLDEYRKEQKELDKETEEFDEMFTAIDGFDIITMTSDLALLEGDSVKIEMNDNFIEILQSDNYVYQAMDIVGGMK